MRLADDITANASTTFKTAWRTCDGSEVPEPSDLGLGNDSVSFERATALYPELVTWN